MRKFLFCELASLLFSSCDNSYTAKELYGSYAAVGYINTYDTIELKPQDIYHRKVYDKNNKLVFEMDGKWGLQGSNILHFNSYFLNLDRDVSKFPELLTDTSMTVSTYFETRKGVIGFCTGYGIDSNCYRKIK